MDSPDSPSQAIDDPSASSSRPRARKQRRSLEEKRRLVEQTLVAGASVTRIAEAHGVKPNLIFQWRKLYRQGKLGRPRIPPARLLPVTLADAVVETAAGCNYERSPLGLPGTIQIQLAQTQVYVCGSADPVSLRLVLEWLGR